MKRRFKIGDIVHLTTEVYENYDGDNSPMIPDLEDDLVITHVATNTEEHPGFDTGVNEALYDCKYGDNCGDAAGDPVPLSFYDYELH